MVLVQFMWYGAFAVPVIEEVMAARKRDYDRA